MATDDVKALLYVSLGLHRSVHYSDAQNKLSRRPFAMEEAEYKLKLVFLNHGYVQHAGCESVLGHPIRYHW